jgi:hypothetical protein
MTKLLVVLAVLASTQNAATPTSAATASEPRQIAESAMKFVAIDDMKGLFEFIGRHMPMERSELNKIRDATIEQRKKMPGALGKSLGFAFISECRRSEILSRVIYVEKREKNVVRWQFVFYKPRATWAMSAFNWDVNHESLFEPCA